MNKDVKLGLKVYGFVWACFLVAGLFYALQYVNDFVYYFIITVIVGIMIAIFKS